MAENALTSPQASKRPSGVTMLGWGVLIIASLNLVRLVQALRQWDFLAGLPALMPLYLALSGLVWGLFALILSWGIFKGAGWAPGYARLGVLAYSLYFWMDRGLIQHAPERWTNWPFILGLMVLVGGCIFWMLSQPRNRTYFGEHNDR